MAKPHSQQKKKCFVISPIGEQNTDIRIMADKVIKFIIVPLALAIGISPAIRGDKISQPGLITTQVIQNVIDSD